jgi:hypothetical protein
MGPIKFPQGTSIQLEPNQIKLDGTDQILNITIHVSDNAHSSKYDVSLVGVWKEEGKIPDFSGTSFSLHVGRDFGNNAIHVNFFMPPLKFAKEGIPPDEIQCRNNFILIQKYDGSPACVNRETIPKLFERGWMTGVIEDKWTASYVSPDQAFKHIQNFIFNSDIILDFPKASMMKRISPIPVRITGDTTSQICAELKMECPTGHSFDAAYDLNSQIAAFEQSVGLHIYDVKISNSRICHMVDGDTQSYCTKLDVPYNPIFDGNKTTLLSKTIEQWKDMSDEKLYYFYEVYGDEFYIELGKIILKNEIKNMLNLENIVNANDDFTVYVTGIDLSLPPDVYMQTIVNGTDGKRYQFDGGTHTNQILNLSFEKISD